MIQATHFIEQYNATDEYKEYAPHQFNFTKALGIEYLDEQLSVTNKGITIHTVAIFKIQYKDNVQNDPYRYLIDYCNN